MKKFIPIKESLMDDDLYKATMMQAIFHAFPANEAEYRFICRNKTKLPLASFVNEIREQLEHLCTLRYKENELAFMGARPYMKSDFIDFLRLFYFQMRYITVRALGDDVEVIARGPQIHVMNFEIHVVSIVNELYFRSFDTPQVRIEGRKRLNEKINTLIEYTSNDKNNRLNPLEIIEFGTRRRFSADWQREVLETLIEKVPHIIRGTSNLKLAMDMNLVTYGTMAHEYFQTFQAVGVQLRQFQIAALESWVKEYRGSLGIALTDVISMDAFLEDFDLYFAKLYDGLRHDSGCPFIWGEKAIAHYEKLKINPNTKRLVFSDGLDIEKSLALHQTFGDRAMTGFGVGTNLTNDLGVEPLNLIMKLVMCNGQPVAKLTDSPGKTICTDQTFVTYLRQVFQNRFKK